MMTVGTSLWYSDKNFPASAGVGTQVKDRSAEQPKACILRFELRVLERTSATTDARRLDPALQQEARMRSLGTSRKSSPTRNQRKSTPERRPSAAKNKCKMMAVYLTKSWWRQRWYNFLFLQSNGQQRGQKSQINICQVHFTAEHQGFFCLRPLSSFSQ